MIDNDQSTIIEAPEVYKIIPTHSPTAKKQQNVPGKKMLTSTPLIHMLWSIILNQTCRISYLDLYE
jgi:hypothetical protein